MLGGLEESQPGEVTFYTNLVSYSFSPRAQILSQAALNINCALRG